MHTTEKISIKSTFEDELEDMRRALNDSFSDKSYMEMEIKQLCEENARVRASLNDLMEQLEASKAFEQYYNSSIYDKQCYLDRIRELEALYNEQRCLRSNDEAEICRLRSDIAQQMRDYQCLLDIKLSLDLEIAEYGKLLAAEDERLNRFLTCDCIEPSDNPNPSTSC